MGGLDAIQDRLYRAVLERAVRNVLGTGLALQTFAQIADGLPLASVAYDHYYTYMPRLYKGHPISSHTSLCPGAEEAARAFLSESSLYMLAFDDKLLQAYGSATPGHRSFNHRLIELVAVAVHKLAAIMYKQGHRIHDRLPQNADATIELVSSWQSREDEEPSPFPTMLAHLYYGAVDQYPDGVADVVGYWAENRILGGVVIFDRSQAWDDQRMPEPNVYFHSNRAGITIRIYQLLDGQQQALVDFLLSSGSPAETCPLPLSGTDENRKRYEPAYATESKVYRDIWEREPPRHIVSRGGGTVGGCCPHPLDYPELIQKWERLPERFRPPARPKSPLFDFLEAGAPE